jgi:SM-20-related protein
VTIEDSLPATLLANLRKRCDRNGEEHFSPARIGRDSQRQLRESVRGDVIHWLDASNADARLFFSLMDRLRRCLNEALYLGLFAYECHYAIFGAGAFYQKHLDVLQGGDNRLLSTVVYLDDEWTATDGGELILYASDQSVVARVLPAPGRMVIFLSADFPHEVLAAQHERHSISGWFRGRAPAS